MLAEHNVKMLHAIAMDYPGGCNPEQKGSFVFSDHIAQVLTQSRALWGTRNEEEN